MKVEKPTRMESGLLEIAFCRIYRKLPPDAFAATSREVPPPSGPQLTEQRLSVTAGRIEAAAMAVGDF